MISSKWENIHRVPNNPHDINLYVLVIINYLLLSISSDVTTNTWKQTVTDLVHVCSRNRSNTASLCHSVAWCKGCLVTDNRWAHTVPVVSQWQYYKVSSEVSPGSAKTCRAVGRAAQLTGLFACSRGSFSKGPQQRGHSPARAINDRGEHHTAFSEISADTGAQPKCQERKVSGTNPSRKCFI